MQIEALLSVWYMLTLSIAHWAQSNHRIAIIFLWNHRLENRNAVHEEFEYLIIILVEGSSDTVTTDTESVNTPSGFHGIPLV